jgi:SpoVK/Ycf46/Vps4 family AAA+-type ATPase
MDWTKDELIKDNVSLIPFANALVHIGAAKRALDSKHYYDSYCNFMSALSLLNVYGPNGIPFKFEYRIVELLSEKYASGMVFKSLELVVTYTKERINDLTPRVGEAISKMKEISLDTSSGMDTSSPELNAAVKFVCDMRETIGMSKPDSCEFWFNKIVGQEIAKTEIVSGFINPILYPNVYGEMTTGILFYGLPGTGKTLLAKAAVNELVKAASLPGSTEPCVNVVLLTPTGANLKGKYVGETEKNIKMMFTGASELARRVSKKSGGRRTLTIIFIDELDGLVPDRSTAGEGAISVVPAVNTMLQMMDGFGSKKNVVVMGATNFLSTIDSAVKRRFQQRIHVEMPSNTNDYEKLIGMSLRKFLASSVTAKKYADRLGPTQAGTGSKSADFDCENADYCLDTSSTVPWDWQSLPCAKIIKPLFPPSVVTELASKMLTKRKPVPGDVLGPFSPSDVSAVMSMALKNAADEAVRTGLVTPIEMKWDVDVDETITRTVIGRAPTIIRTTINDSDKAEISIGQTIHVKPIAGVFKWIVLSIDRESKKFYNIYYNISNDEFLSAGVLEKDIPEFRKAIQNIDLGGKYHGAYMWFNNTSIQVAYDNLIHVWDKSELKPGDKTDDDLNKAFGEMSESDIRTNITSFFYRRDNIIRDVSLPYHVLYVETPVAIPSYRGWLSTIFGGAPEVHDVVVIGYDDRCVYGRYDSRVGGVLLPINGKSYETSKFHLTTFRSVILEISSIIGITEHFYGMPITDPSIAIAYITTNMRPAAIEFDTKISVYGSELMSYNEDTAEFDSCDDMFDSYVMKYCYDISPNHIMTAINNTLPSISEKDRRKMAI